ncbi:MAG: transporter substrate-binding domain-containing protein [Magnetococcales bacterium]|nr:transporter substrate-binding domain-containing protein [Magnetococcales bacterium]NGZ04965.1 transporter substrate-binding domain-containing protein [Magnetococcales bacterium]
MAPSCVNIPAVRWIRSLLIFLVGCGWGAGSLLADEPTLTAHIRHRPPYMIVQGQYLGGSLKEILDLAAQRLGYRVAWRDVPFSTSIEEMKTGQVDIVPRVIMTEERKGWVHFLTPIGHELQEILFLTRKGHEKTIRNYEDLHKLKIGVKKGTAYFSRFDKDTSLQKNSFSGDDYGLLDLLITGQVDTIIILDRRAMESALAGLGFTDYGYAQFRLIQNLELNYGLSKNSQYAALLDALERELQAMRASGEVDAILARQVALSPATALNARLTPAEKAWLNANPGPFRVYNAPALRPFNFIDEQGPRGFSIDYLDLLATRLAIPIQYVAGAADEDPGRKLARQEVDIVLDPLTPTSDQEEGLVFTRPYAGSPSGMALRASMSVLRDLLDQAAALITPEELKRMQEKWPEVAPGATHAVGTEQDPRTRLRLTAQESAWLKSHPKIRLGTGTANPPFELLQEGKQAGMIADLVALLARGTGLEILPIQVVAHDAVRGVTSGQIDLVPLLTTTDQPVDSVLMTDPFLTFPVMIVMHRDGGFVSGLDELAGQKVAVVADGPVARLLARHHGSLNLIPLPDLNEALQAVQNREVAAMVENVASISHGINQLNLESLRVIAPTPYLTGLYLGVRSDWPELRTILIKAMQQISTQEKNTIRNAWMSVQVQIGIEMAQLVLYGVPIVVTVVLILSMVMFWNRRLQREVVERRQAEWALEAAEERGRLLLESIGEGIFGLDQEGRFHFINPSGAAMLGVDAAGIMGKKFCLLNSHDTLDGVGCLQEECQLRQRVNNAGQGGDAAQHLFWRRDGTSFPAEYSCHPIYKQDQYLGMVVTFRDISERLQQEQRIRVLSNAVEQSPISIVITDPEARIQYVNPTFTRISGYEAQEVLGHNPRMVKSGKMDPVIYEQMWATLLSGETWEGELLNRKKDGELYWEATTISPILDHNGQISHYLANKEEITRRKQFEEQLREALQLVSSSITYASRIQRSILTPSEVLHSALPDHFVLWEPRDMVGGDMYWYRPWITGILLILGDCTGHGVPGAFITLIANGALDQALLETPPGDTATLLQRMHQLIQLALGQHRPEGASNDGLELGVCYLDPESPDMVFSGARFSLFVVDDSEVREIKGNKTGIGYRGVDWNVTFANHTVELRPEWRYYMTSDGLIDQIGGQPRRGFGRQRFMQLLSALRPVVPMTEQGVKIREALAEFQGEEKRRDDVSVVGFRGIVH